MIELAWLAVSGGARRGRVRAGRRLRNWVKIVRIDDGELPGTTSADAKRIAELEKENRELRRANTILRQASAYFAQAELDRR